MSLYTSIDFVFDNEEVFSEMQDVLKGTDFPISKTHCFSPSYDFINAAAQLLTGKEAVALLAISHALASYFRMKEKSKVKIEYSKNDYLYHIEGSGKSAEDIYKYIKDSSHIGLIENIEKRVEGFYESRRNIQFIDGDKNIQAGRDVLISNLMDYKIKHKRQIKELKEIELEIEGVSNERIMKTSMVLLPIFIFLTAIGKYLEINSLFIGSFLLLALVLIFSFKLLTDNEEKTKNLKNQLSEKSSDLKKTELELEAIQELINEGEITEY